MSLRREAPSPSFEEAEQFPSPPNEESPTQAEESSTPKAIQKESITMPSSHRGATAFLPEGKQAFTQKTPLPLSEEIRPPDYRATDVPYAAPRKAQTVHARKAAPDPSATAAGTDKNTVPSFGRLRAQPFYPKLKYSHPLPVRNKFLDTMGRWVDPQTGVIASDTAPPPPVPTVYYPVGLENYKKGGPANTINAPFRPDAVDNVFAPPPAGFEDINTRLIAKRKREEGGEAAEIRRMRDFSPGFLLQHTDRVYKDPESLAMAARAWEELPDDHPVKVQKRKFQIGKLLTKDSGKGKGKEKEDPKVSARWVSFLSTIDDCKIRGASDEAKTKIKDEHEKAMNAEWARIIKEYDTLADCHDVEQDERSPYPKRFKMTPALWKKYQDGLRTDLERLHTLGREVRAICHAHDVVWKDRIGDSIKLREHKAKQRMRIRQQHKDAVKRFGIQQGVVDGWLGSRDGNEAWLKGRDLKTGIAPPLDKTLPVAMAVFKASETTGRVSRTRMPSPPPSKPITWQALEKIKDFVDSLGLTAALVRRESLLQNICYDPTRALSRRDYHDRVKKFDDLFQIMSTIQDTLNLEVQKIIEMDEDSEDEEETQSSSKRSSVNRTLPKSPIEPISGLQNISHKATDSSHSIYAKNIKGRQSIEHSKTSSSATFNEIPRGPARPQAQPRKSTIRSSSPRSSLVSTTWGFPQMGGESRYKSREVEMEKVEEEGEGPEARENEEGEKEQQFEDEGETWKIPPEYKEPEDLQKFWERYGDIWYEEVDEEKRGLDSKVEEAEEQEEDGESEDWGGEDGESEDEESENEESEDEESEDKESEDEESEDEESEDEESEYEESEDEEGEDDMDEEEVVVGEEDEEQEEDDEDEYVGSITPQHKKQTITPTRSREVLEPEHENTSEGSGDSSEKPLTRTPGLRRELGMKKGS